MPRGSILSGILIFTWNFPRHNALMQQIVCKGLLILRIILPDRSPNKNNGPAHVIMVLIAYWYAINIVLGFRPVTTIDYHKT